MGCSGEIVINKTGKKTTLYFITIFIESMTAI